MSNIVILGTQWGDEGKGKIVDILTHDADIIVRFQGGPNAGHTVVVGDKQTILHQIPSGILHSNKMCVVGNGVVIDIETLFNEIDEVKSQGYFPDDSSLMISGNAHLIMPYHKKIDLAREKMKGVNKIGTTGRGIGPAYEDKSARSGIRFCDIFNEQVFKDKLKITLQEKNFFLKQYFGEEPLDVEEILSLFSKYRDKAAKYAGNTSDFLHNSLKKGNKILFEGAQGTLLDIDHGTYPFVTSSNTVAAQASIGTGIGPKHLDNITGITKAYTTRVGSGPFPTEQNNDTGEYLRDKGGEYGSTTGRPRRCGWLDLATVKHSILTNTITHLIITKLDVLSGLKNIKICTGYKSQGRHLPCFPTDLTMLENVEPVYDELVGWEEDISSITRFDDLPDAAKKYIEYIENKTGVPTAMVSVGTRRNQIIKTKDLFAADNI
jgi:adenylosuccinate synthase